MMSCRKSVFLALFGLVLLCSSPLYAKNMKIEYETTGTDPVCVKKDTITIDGVSAEDSEIPVKKFKQQITWTLPMNSIGTWTIERKTEAPMRMCQANELPFVANMPNQPKRATCRTKRTSMPKYSYNLLWSHGGCPSIKIDPAIIFDEPDKLMPFIPFEVGRFVFPILTVVFALTTLFSWRRARLSRRA